jgi:hypothetical protein
MVLKCEMCGAVVEPVDGEIELHDGSKVAADRWACGFFDDGKPHWVCIRPRKAGGDPVAVQANTV